MRSAVNQATNAATTAGQTGANFGAQAGNINSSLTPFLMREMNSPQGFSQQDQTAQTSAALSGAGGAAGAAETAAGERAAATGNQSGFGLGADQGVRDAAKGAAAASEGVAAKNADLKQTQMQEGARGLGQLGQQDIEAQLKSMGLISQDVNAAADAGKSGWLQNLEGIMKMINGVPGIGH